MKQIIEMQQISITEIEEKMIETKRVIKKLRKRIASVQHLIDKDGAEIIYRDETLITVYSKSIRLNY